ncbi:hypothetical protein ScPMuIL_011480 [Solemya velum]
MADDIRSRVMGDENYSSVLSTMIFFSLAILFLPVFLYFFSKSMFFEALLGMSSKDSYFYAAIVAITVVHIILGLFVYKAFKEDTGGRMAKID